MAIICSISLEEREETAKTPSLLECVSTHALEPHGLFSRRAAHFKRWILLAPFYKWETAKAYSWSMIQWSLGRNLEAGSLLACTLWAALPAFLALAWHHPEPAGPSHINHWLRKCPTSIPDKFSNSFLWPARLIVVLTTILNCMTYSLQSIRKL